MSESAAMSADALPAPTEPELPAVGSIVAGKYELVRIIGKGGMGLVYEAKHLRLNQRVAIKMLRPAALHVSDFKPRFEREARTAALLRGRHVARIFDVDTTESGLPFMVMEYLVGRDLDAELQERGTLSVMEATGYVLQACIAMEEAHAAGIVHRDLKPANLFLTEENGERVVKVLDFGISKLTHEVDTHLTGTFATVGTPLYMSPEQVRSSRSVDARSDVWSLAVILFESLAGQPPFHGSMTATAAAIVADKTPSLSALRPDVPPEMEAAIMCALQKHPNRRFQDVTSLSLALAPFGPPRLPESLSNPSLPVPPVSRPMISSRLSAPGSSPRGSDWGSAAETIMIPGDERGGAGQRAYRARLRSLVAASLGGALLAGTIVILSGGARAPKRAASEVASSSEMPVSDGLAPSASARPTPAVDPSAAPSGASPSVVATVANTVPPKATPAAAVSAHPKPAVSSPAATARSAAVAPRVGSTLNTPPPPANPVFLQ